jgi:hypothetical protein
MDAPRVIVSHDVDHLGFFEHSRDLIVPKLLVRGVLETFAGRIPVAELVRRAGAVAANRNQHIFELLEFDTRHGIRPTFFIAMGRGLGLAYNRPAAQDWVRRLSDQPCDLGIHGIAFDDEAAMKDERDAFADALGHDAFGMRMHYLRSAASTQDRLGRLGYLFDATLPGDGSPVHREDGLWMFPLHVMDGWQLMGGARWQRHTADEAVAATAARFEALWRQGADCLSLNFHDSYYTSAFASWRAWYERTIDWLRGRGARFLTYVEAMRELEEEMTA